VCVPEGLSFGNIPGPLDTLTIFPLSNMCLLYIDFDRFIWFDDGIDVLSLNFKYLG
jgi:hypothetical protein